MPLTKSEPITFREILYDDLGAFCALEVAPQQQGLVTPNVMTMAEAPYEAGALVRGIWLGDRPAGLIAMLRPSAYPEDQDITIRRDAAYLWRLMVDHKFQGQGLGNAAVNEARRTAAAWGYRGITLTAGEGPHSAIPFYQRCGFVLTGRRLWDDAGEQEMVLWFDG